VIPTALQLPGSILVSAGAACLLFGLLAREFPWRRRPPRRRLRPFALGATYVALTSTGEELLWRWLVLGGLAPLVGLAPAFLTSSVGFALAHGPKRRDVLAVHLLTGSVFGAVYVGTGRIEAAVVTHVLYNWLVLAAIESGAPAPQSASMTCPAVLDGVRKRYRKVEALRGFSLSVEAGEVVALLGPNGAGKTTALWILLGLRSPDDGTATLFGRDPRDPEARRWVGVTPQETGFPTTLRVAEVVDLVRAHYPAPLRTRDALARFGLGEVTRRQVGGLSSGQKRRLAVTLAFVGNPRAVVLDEPTTGLDVEARRGVWEAVRAFGADGGTVLLTTHYLEEADALASRVVMLSNGKTVAEGSPAEVKARAGLQRVRVETDSLPELAGVERATFSERVHTLYTRDPELVVRQLVAAGVSLRGLEVHPATLEEVFLSLTGNGA
jgi:ABC-2 type transport system ATP-binding protein